MKVAVLIDTWLPFVGGGQINVWEISKNLASPGVEIDIITRNNGNYKDVKVKNLRIIKLGKESLPDDNVSKLLYTLNSLFFLFKNNYDIVHAHAFLPGITARLIMVFKGAPVVFTVHGTSVNTNLNGKLSRVIEKFILTQILYSAQITVSRDFLTIKNINKNVVYIPNGVNKIFFKMQSRLRRNKNSILFVGRLHPQKNLPSLIRAIKLLKVKNPKLKLTIAGDGPQKKELQSLIKSEKLENDIELRGIVKNRDLVKLYYKSKMFVLPSIYEGQPLSVLEAFATKTPVVASKTGDIPFLLANGENGYLIKNPQTPKNIAHAIEEALKCKKLSERGYILVKENYSWELAAKKTYDVYTKISKN